MRVKLSLANTPPALGKQILVDPKTNLPRICASLWLSQNEQRYSESYISKYLVAIDSLYYHSERRLDAPVLLDKAMPFIRLLINKIGVS